MMPDWFRWAFDSVLLCVLTYIGWRQTSHYRKEDIRKEEEIAYKQEIKTSIDKVNNSIIDTYNTIMGMFKTHTHEVLCDNDDCTKTYTGKVMVEIPLVRRIGDDKK